MSVSLDPLVETLEDEDVDVDEARQLAMDLSLMYWYDEETRVQDIATIALCAASVPQLFQNVFTATAITTVDGEDARVGMFFVPRETAVEYNEGRLSKREYLQQVLDTWEEPWGEP